MVPFDLFECKNRLVAYIPVNNPNHSPGDYSFHQLIHQFVPWPVYFLGGGAKPHSHPSLSHTIPGLKMTTAFSEPCVTQSVHTFVCQTG